MKLLNYRLPTGATKKMSGRQRGSSLEVLRRRAGRALPVAAVVVAALLVPSAASAAPLWTSTPRGGWECSARDNRCVKHTGFKPNFPAKYWGQDRNSKGNCTSYVAHRLIRNGARDPGFNGSGGARAWAGVAGTKRVNGTPAVGSIAWWDGAGAMRAGGFGHVAYVEKVAGGTVYLSDSRYPVKPGSGGSSRWTVSARSENWPDGFLHVKDAPSKPKGASPRGRIERVTGEPGNRVQVVGWALTRTRRRPPSESTRGSTAGRERAARAGLISAGHRRRGAMSREPTRGPVPNTDSIPPSGTFRQAPTLFVSTL